MVVERRWDGAFPLTLVTSTLFGRRVVTPLLLSCVQWVPMSVDDQTRHNTAQLRQYEALLEINNAVVSQLDLRELLKAISLSLRKVIPHDAALLTLYDPETGQLRLQALDLQVFGRVPLKRAC